MKSKIKITTIQTDYKGKSIFERMAEELCITDTFSDMDDILILALLAMSRVDAPKKPFLANSSKALISNLLFESDAIVLKTPIFKK